MDRIRLHRRLKDQIVLRECSRRQFLASSTGVALAALSSPRLTATVQAAAEKPVDHANLPIVDTHVHLWDLSKLRLPWMSLPKGKPLAHNFLLKDYDAATAGANVVKTVYMEVACDPSNTASRPNTSSISAANRAAGWPAR